MMLKRTFELLLTFIIGLAFILIGALVPATSIVKWVLTGIGIIMVINNILNIIFTKGKIMFELVNSLIGVGLGVLMIIFPMNFLNIIIALYLIVIPLINIFYFKKLLIDRDIIKLVFGIIFLLFSPFFFGVANTIIGIFLIIIGAIIIVGTISSFIYLLRVKNTHYNETNEKINVSKDGVDFDFSDKN